MIVVAVGGRAIAQDEQENSKAEKLPADVRSQLTEELKPLIEQEVERRLKVALEALKTAPAAQGKPQDPATQAQVDELNKKVDQVVEAQKKVHPGEFNPAIGLVGETLFSYRNRGPAETGSDRPGGIDIFQRSIELNIAAAVDPFFRAYAVINASADAATGEAVMAVEEASLVSTSLPLNLTLQAGRFFAEFGRLGYIHDHELPFVNRPLALDMYMGGETKTDGAQINWLAPLDHYISVSAGLGDQFGDAPNDPGQKRGLSELNFWGRISTYFDITPDWQLDAGVSGLINPRSDGRGDFNPTVIQPDLSTVTEKRRGLVGFDLKLNYVPLVDNQFSGFTLGTEVLFSDNRYSIDPDATPGTGDEFIRRVGAWGTYVYVVYKLDRQWSLGAMAEHAENPENRHDITSAYSPYITWATSHWNQIRLQFTHTEHNKISGLKDDNAFYIQWTWIIGAHSHGWQAR